MLAAASSALSPPPTTSDLPAAVLLGVNQPIDHLRQLFARHAEFARRAAPTDRQQHRRGERIARPLVRT